MQNKLDSEISLTSNNYMEKGTLYIVATPIGNLSDITFRAVEILKSVDFAACEDTRKSKILLNHYNIKTPLVSYHQHSKFQKIDFLLSKLKDGKNIALITDAGTPGISDPGNKLVEEVLKEEIKVVPIPGPSALSALISVSGIDLTKFTFLGFPPNKKGRETFFHEVVATKHPAIYYESPYRLMKNLELLSGLKEDMNLIVGKELTKIFEETARGKAGEILEYFKKNPNKVRGEFVIIAF
jgi:16S rRNA (cytidine1402-2'-O)-methyltransferase